MKKAVVIIHGFVGSLYDNEYLMNYLSLDKDFSVFAHTLPGHHEEDSYQKVEYQEWPKFIDKIIENLISYGYKNIYIIGHSMGGILAGYVASKYKEVKKIVFLNAAYQYLNFRQNKIDMLKNKDYKDYVEVFDRVLHTSIPFFLEFTKLVKEYYVCLDSIKQDSLILQSNMDQVIPIENGISIYEHIQSQHKYLTYLIGCRHGIFSGKDENMERKKEIAEYIRLFLKGGSKWQKSFKEKI